MKYTCDSCKKEFEGEPGYLSYGLLKGTPFYTKLCPECKQNLTEGQLEEFEEKGKILNKTE